MNTNALGSITFARYGHHVGTDYGKGMCVSLLGCRFYDGLVFDTRKIVRERTIHTKSNKLIHINKNALVGEEYRRGLCLSLFAFRSSLLDFRFS